MELAWIAAALALLYAWLAGWWFARIIVFLGIGVTLLLASHNNSDGQVAAALLAVAGWFVSGIPLYVRRWMTRRDRKTFALMLPD